MLKLLVGPMYSGKSSSLIRKATRHKYGKKEVLLFNSHLDTRYGENGVISHNRVKIDAIAIKTVDDVINAIQYVSGDDAILFFDECQFYSNDIIRLIIDLSEHDGFTIYCSMLDLTFDNTPFDAFIMLAPYANDIAKLKAVCVECGEDATKSYRTTDDTNTVKVGSDGEYVALCTKCYHDKF